LSEFPRSARDFASGLPSALADSRSLAVADFPFHQERERIELPGQQSLPEPWKTQVEGISPVEKAIEAAAPEQSQRMRLSPSSLWILGAWVVLVGGYVAGALVAQFELIPQFVPRSRGLTTFGDVLQCIAPLFANAGLLLNAASPHRRWNMFWMLLGLGCTLWLVAQLMWTYIEVVLQQPPPNPFPGDIFIFVHIVPMIGALALLPHRRKVGAALRYGGFDLFLMATWWVYLYVFFVMPWQVTQPNPLMYTRRFTQVFAAENLLFLVLLALLSVKTSGGWRKVYGHLLGAGALYFLGSHVTNLLIGGGSYYTGSLYDVPLVASFVWFGTAGILASRQRLAPLPAPTPSRSLEFWPARIAMGCVLSLPALAAWSMLFSEAPAPIKKFRIILTLGAFFAGTLLVFLRQHLVDRERIQLLRKSQESLENLKRLQTQFVQSEKLASLGQLAAGAAHEINNPLTAILGYTDLLGDDPGLSERQRTLVGKLREQARRTKTLVNNLLSFARQVPVEKALLDVNGVVASAVQLRTLDLRDKNIRIELQTGSVVPGVRGDPNQLLQVFFNLISNAVDAMEEMGGGVLTVRVSRERANVVIEFSDTGPGIREPHLVFDPFYTTKPVGKGTGLGLSICYGIVQEHGGRISGFNRPGGGATFRVELPAVIALFPQATPPSSAKNS